ncbi:phage tail tape measure protein [Microbacterium maritypicum]
MTDRSVFVTVGLRAQGYMQGMREMGRATDEVGSKAEKLAAQRQGFETLGRAAVGFGAAMALGVGVAVSKWAEFDQQMSYVQAATHETAANMDLLREAALEAGARTVFSATEAAAAIEELGKAGVSTEDILSGGLDASLDLAAAGGIAVADAAGIAATALKTFNLQGSDMSHVADLLAAGAGKAMGDVSDLSQALAQGGQVAKQTGLSIEETTAGLAAFAAQGLLGSDAGTSFKSMLQRLTPQSNEAKQKMDELGISAYDAAGNFIGLAEFAGNLQKSLQRLTPEQRNSALATIFGSDAVRAATVLYTEGEAGIRKWTAAVDDQGYAAETAAMRLDNLLGDWEAFTGALDTAFITMGAGVDGPLRAFVQGLTGIVDGFNELPDGAQQAVLWVGLITAGVALAGGAALLAVPKIAAFKVGLQTLGITAASTRAGLGRVVGFLGGPWGIALVAAATAVTLFNKNIEEGVPAQAELVNAIKTSSDAVKGFQAAFERGGFETFWLGDYADQLKDLPALLDKASTSNVRWLDMTFNETGALDSIKRYGDALSELAQTDMPAAQLAFRGLTEQYELNADQSRQLLDEMPAYRDALLKIADEHGITADSAEFLQLAMGELPGTTAEVESAMAQVQQATEEATNAFNAASDALKGIADTAIGLGEAKDAALSAINAMTEAASAEGVALDGSNEASIKLRDSIREVESAHRDSAQAIIENGGTLEEAQAEWQKGRDAVLGMLEAKGLDATQAGIWADAQLGSAAEVRGGIDEVYRAWLNMPENVDTKYAVEAAEAEQKLANLKARLDAIPEHKYTRITLESFQVDGGRTVSNFDNAIGNLYDKGKKITAYAGGGMTSGIYSPVPGGIQKFAEAGWSEAFITMNPAFRDRSIDIWAETGRRLGAYQPGPASAPAIQVAAPSLEGLTISGRLELGADGIATLIGTVVQERGEAVARSVRHRKWGDA